MELWNYPTTFRFPFFFKNEFCSGKYEFQTVVSFLIYLKLKMFKTVTFSRFPYFSYLWKNFPHMNSLIKFSSFESKKKHFRRKHNIFNFCQHISWKIRWCSPLVNYDLNNKMCKMICFSKIFLKFSEFLFASFECWY